MPYFDLTQQLNNLKTSPAVLAQYSLSYHDLLRTVFRFSQILKTNNFESGEKVAVVLKHLTSFSALFLALITEGIVIVPIDPKIPDTILNNMLRKIDCFKIITDVKLSHTISSKIKVYQISDLFKQQFSENDNFSSKPISLDQECSIIFTSGSSENPKAVLHTFGNHYYSALGSNSNIQFGNGNRWLLSLPLYHVSGFSILFRALVSGGTVVIPDAELSLAENIVKYDVTHISLVAAQLFKLLEDKNSTAILSKLKAILLGGSQIPAELINQSIKNGLPVHTTYGSTEMASQITTTQSKESPEKLFSSGKVLPYRAIKIAADGEILVKGKTLFKGYVEKQNLIKPFDNEGWFRTGDLGTIDPQGYLHVLGRKDNMFISGGENIFPEEIEKVLLKIKGVEKAFVFDIPDAEFGARPIAFLKVANVTKSDIMHVLIEHLPKYKIPDAFFYWPEDDVSLKPNRKEFKIMYEGGKLKEIS